MIGRTTITTSLFTFALAGIAASARAAEPLAARTFVGGHEAVACALALTAFVLTGAISAVALIARHPDVTQRINDKMAETSTSVPSSPKTPVLHAVTRRRPLLDTKLSDTALKALMAERW